MACISCGRGLHGECFNNPCCCSTGKKEESIPFSSTGEDSPRIGRPPKPNSEITTSAGRKRAAILYPINEGESCDWQGLANCGGGKFPITGCLNGKQQHRHHGPIKNTSHNEDTNIHRICDNCHNLWHAKNDPVYSEEEYALLPHEPRQSTPAEKLARGV
jgi:hypothetical protein